MAKASVEERLLAAAGGEAPVLGVREEVKKQLWLAGPLIAGALLQNVIQMISVMYVGHLGELPLAGRVRGHLLRHRHRLQPPGMRSTALLLDLTCHHGSRPREGAFSLPRSIETEASICSNNQGH
jgi:hypothetical protein